MAPTMPPPPKKFGYPQSYRLRPLTEQILLLSAACKKLDLDIDADAALEFAHGSAAALVPDGFEGWQVALRPGLVGPHDHQDRRLALELIDQISPEGIDNRFGDELDEDQRFRSAPFTLDAIARMCEKQGGDVFVFPFQSGARYSMMSDERAAQNFNEDSGEFGLDFLTGASHLVTHPERLGRIGHLGISFPGEYYDYDHNDSFRRVTLIKIIQNRTTVMHCPESVEWTNDHGAASGKLWE